MLLVSELLLVVLVLPPVMQVPGVLPEVSELLLVLHLVLCDVLRRQDRGMPMLSMLALHHHGLPKDL